jgi:hypothetical protein
MVLFLRHRDEPGITERDEAMGDSVLTTEEWAQVLKACAWIKVSCCTPLPPYLRAFIAGRLRAFGHSALASSIERFDQGRMQSLCEELRERQARDL